MRMWMVQPQWMCIQHRTGEHGEIHKHRHNFEKGHSIAKRVERNQIEPSSMGARHDKLAEYLGKHKSPYQEPTRHPRTPIEHWEYKVDRDASLMLLLVKCPSCRAMFRNAQSAY